MSNELEIIQECIDFLKQSSEHYHTFKDRKKNDLMLYSGDFWNDSTVKSWNRKTRHNEQINQWSTMSSAIVSPFSSSPWHIQLRDTKDEMAQNVQDTIDAIEAESDNKNAYKNAFRNAVRVGEGAVVVTTVEDALTHEPKIIVENVRDIGSVAWDPSVTTTSAKDAEACAIVNYLPLRKARRLYGSDIVPADFPTHKPMIYDFGEQWESKPEKCIPLVTYYRLEDSGNVGFYKMIGDRIVEHAELPCTTIPVLRFTGWEVLRNNKYDYVGIIDKTYSIQLGLNLSYSTMLERAGRSVKANFIMPVGAADGLEEYYARCADDDSLMLLYNAAAGKPEQIRESFETGDLTNMLACTQQLMSAIVGVPVEGINGIQQDTKTATEILQQQVNAESNVDELYTAAFEVSQQVGKIIIQLLTNGQTLDFALESGPSVITQSMKRRQELTVLATLIPDNMKPILAKYFADTLTTSAADKLADDIVANMDASIKLVADKDIDPYAAHELTRLNMVAEDAMKVIEEKDAKIADLEQQVNSIMQQLYNNREKNQLDFQKFAIKQQDDMAIKSAELELKAAELQEKGAVDAQKMQHEAQRVQIQAQDALNDTIADTNNGLGI